MIERIEKMLVMYESGAIDRRQFLNGLVAASVAPHALAQEPKAAFRGRIINHVTLSVADVNRSRAFYQGLLGATVIGAPTNSKEPPKSFDLRVGDKWQDAIESEIAGCHCAVVLLSPNVRKKPDWVNAEAYAFSLRLRVFDPDFRMVPVLLDGFTEAELATGPLAKAKLAEIQAPTMTSAALDVPAILGGLRPVLDQYRALLPFQQIARALPLMRNNPAGRPGGGPVHGSRGATRSLSLIAKRRRPR